MGFSYRENYVCMQTLFGDENGNFKLEKGRKSYPWSITGGTFEVTDVDVTKDQDPDHHLKAGNIHRMDKDHRFLFKFGRHGDSEVAKRFNKRCPPEHNTFNHTAGKLNFWVKGTLALAFESGETYTFPNTYFAQGKAGAANNWWFGNDGMTNSSVPILAWDPYSTKGVPIPVYLGRNCYGIISPSEDSNLILKFKRGDGAIPNPSNAIDLVGIYYKDKP